MSRFLPLAGKHILLLSRYGPLGPSSRLRMFQFIPALEAAGASVTVSPFFGDNYLSSYFSEGRKSKREAASAVVRRVSSLISAGRFDIAWVEKEAFPFLPAAAEAILRAVRLPYVVDYDDATFHTYDKHESWYVRQLLSSKLDGLIWHARAVTVGNAYLEDYVRPRARCAVIRVPTVVDVLRYPVLPFPHAPATRIGWIGTPNNARYLRPVVEAMRALKSELPLQLVTVGAPSIPMIDGQEILPWTLETEAANVGGFDFGVMPIPDESFERGKCGYKLIQYLAAGRPVLASPVGANSEIVTPNVGLLPASVAEWKSAISLLAGDHALVSQMGMAGRQRAEQYYSLQITAPRIVNIFVQALNGISL